MKKLIKLIAAIILGLGIGFLAYIFKIVKEDEEATDDLYYPEEPE